MKFTFRIGTYRHIELREWSNETKILRYRTYLQRFSTITLKLYPQTWAYFAKTGAAVKITYIAGSRADDTVRSMLTKKERRSQSEDIVSLYTFLLLRRFKLYLGAPLAYEWWTFQINEVARDQTFFPDPAIFVVFALDVSCFPLYRGYRSYRKGKRNWK